MGNESAVLQSCETPQIVMENELAKNANSCCKLKGHDIGKKQSCVELETEEEYTADKQ